VWQGLAARSFAEDVDYTREVRPILSQYCFKCHGPDDKKREGGLRLDVREAALKPAESGEPAIVPGKPDASELVKRIVSQDPDEQMPPATAKMPLTGAQKAVLRRWVEAGANYEQHWAFQPLAKVTPPPVKDTKAVRNAIDQFIIAKLEREGVRPAPPADKATLLRRVYLDLVGLLPTPEEQQAFLKDDRPDAYEQVVEKLLKSPHYGERWGRHWLDQARYADSNGYTIDGEREMWPYRDWVIQALNDDLPFDQFTIEQLAGDLLPHPTKKQLVATAFHRNTLINQEGGVDREQFRVESVVDRVNTTGAVWLGLTVLCCQCHNHKYDPIAQREYYQLFAFFNQTQDANDKGPTVDVARGEMFGQPLTPKQPAVVADTKTRAQWEQSELDRLQKLAGMSTDKPAAVQWTPAKYVEYDTATGAGFELLKDNSLLSDGRGAFNDTYRIAATTNLKQIAAVRLRVLTHDSLPHQGPGRAGNGNFVLTTFELKHDDKVVPLARATADHEQPNYPVTAAIDDSSKTGWAINVGKGSQAKMNANHEAVFVLAQPLAIGDKPCEVRLYHGLNENYLIGRFALDFAETAPASEVNPAERELFTALKTPAAKRSDKDKALIQKAFDQTHDKTANGKKNKSDNADLMVMRDGSQRDTYLLTKGDFTRPNKELGPIAPGVLSILTPNLAQARNRLDLAKWLVHPENPLPPRVAVNRMWMRYFGKGLVETEEDFGLQGTPPTHPELLDWLAAEFRRQGWSQKALHRLIVTSATYRQSSAQRPDLRERDPRNYWLARQERLRLDAEILRDAALSASGLLDTTVGGPSVHPPQPDGVFSFTQNKKSWNTDAGPARYRRAMYTFFYRSAPYPLFSTFDVPDFQSVCTRRPRSNTPLQSLMIANDAAFFEMAQALAARAIAAAPAADAGEARLRYLGQVTLNREITPAELQVLQAHVVRRTADFRQDAAGAEKLVPPNLKKQLNLPLAETAALVSAARIVLNSDAFLCRE